MSERRALLAVLLIFLLFFGYTYFARRGAEAPESGEVMTETAGEQAPAVAAPELTTTAEPVADTDGAETRADLETPGEGRAVETTVIETPLYRATLSNRGASLVSFELKEYRDAEGRMVDLVPPGDPALGVLVRFGANAIDTGDWIFEPSLTGTVTLREGEGTRTVRFDGERADGLALTTVYTFRSDSYLFDMSTRLSGVPGSAGGREIALGWPGVLPTEEKEDDRGLATVIYSEEDLERLHLGNFRKEAERTIVGNVSWVTSQSRYFIAALLTDGSPFERVEAFSDQERRTVGFRAVRPVEAGSDAVELRVYAGPQDYIRINSLGLELGRAVDLGWSITRPLSVLMLRALVWAHGVVPNYGLVIIIFSILTKLLFYRLTHKSFTEMKRMQELQPKLEELKKSHGDDREKLAKEQMELYKKEGVNPLGGCLPMLLQMPVFIALFQVLRTTIELRGAPFALWITDLSQPDTIATIAGFSIHILPLLMGVGMLVQQRFSSTDPSQAMVGRLMPILFTVLFYNFASGLVLYWLVNTALSVAQQYYIHKRPAKDSAGGDATAPRGDTTATPPPSFQTASDEGKPGNGNARKTSSKKRRNKKRR
jgi:YidC/Oxa1 family membrane protein insertase